MERITLAADKGYDTKDFGLSGSLIRCGSPALQVYKVDTGLLSRLAELRAHEKQAAES